MTSWRALVLPAGAGALGLAVLVQAGPREESRSDSGATAAGPVAAAALDPAAAKEFGEKIEPLLEEFCFDCHGDGSSKGDISLDKYEDLSAHLNDHDLWLRIWQNVRTHLMPPAEEDFKPSEEERAELSAWIESRVFRIDPENPDPGRVTIRRLNREEYRNTIEDLVGVEFNVDENFPPDDTGFGFDTIGDVLSLSPLLLEKYLAASEEIAGKAMPENAGRPDPIRIDAGNFREPGNGNQSARFMEADIDHTVGAEREFGADGRYAFEVKFDVKFEQSGSKGQTAEWRILLDGAELEKREVRWDRRGGGRYKGEIEMTKGRHRFEFHITPKEARTEGDGTLGVEVQEVTLRRLGSNNWDLYPDTFKRIYFKGPAPEDREGQAAYMREIVERFMTRAYRRPPEAAVVDRLTSIALAKAGEGGMKFVDGVRLAVTATLTSPSFLFRSEVQAEPDNPGKVVPIDEYALASRLSYFLWSSCPDEELLRLAKEGALRANLRAQVDRLLDDKRSERLVRNFVGQWLQTRDLTSVNIDVRRILDERSRREAERVFNDRTRRDMRTETERFFEHVVRENRPAIELLTANYSFLNDDLARFYGVPGVSGGDFRKVEFGEDLAARGGILGQGTFLIVTSNPTRTSPVKRGLFVLDNILGTPAPPAPPNVPDLEVAKKKADSGTMRELMILHREKALCNACHARMDPIGLALENFNAIGQWRAEENGKPIDTAGQLITGEKFSNVMELKQILGTSRKQDFHRCLTEKMLTYALGRGVEYYDAPTVDSIVARLNTGGGGVRELIYGVVESAPFQKRRGDGALLGSR